MRLLDNIASRQVRTPVLASSVAAEDFCELRAHKELWLATRLASPPSCQAEPGLGPWHLPHLPRLYSIADLARSVFLENILFLRPAAYWPCSG